MVEENKRTIQHRRVCSELTKTYKNKNRDYGNSFVKVREEFPNAILIRLSDKLNRLKSLYSGGDRMVRDESIRDTLLDLANYCILEVIEIDMVKSDFEDQMSEVQGVVEQHFEDTLIEGEID